MLVCEHTALEATPLPSMPLPKEGMCYIESGKCWGKGRASSIVQFSHEVNVSTPFAVHGCSVLGRIENIKWNSTKPIFVYLNVVDSQSYFIKYGKVRTPTEKDRLPGQWT